MGVQRSCDQHLARGHPQLPFLALATKRKRERSIAQALDGQGEDDRVAHAADGAEIEALAVTTAKRSAAFPDIPTVAESGAAGYDVAIWTALMAPKGTPEPVLAKLRAAVKDILAEKDTIEKMHTLGMDPGNADSAALAKRIAADIARWSAVAKAANIKPE